MCEDQRNNSNKSFMGWSNGMGCNRALDSEAGPVGAEYFILLGGTSASRLNQSVKLLILNKSTCIIS